jgi:AAHS family 4-hydroxybenzoate transporter-like MFS transporter
MTTSGWSGYQKLVVFLIALTIIFDGIDNQLLGIAIPSIMRDWSVPRAPFAFVLACGMFGMMLGGALAGLTGDRFGRKVALLGSVVVFGVLTLAASAASSLTMLAALRFLAGLGLGGALPNAAALASEFVPERSRALAVTIAIVCVPFGGMLAATLAEFLLPSLGWRGLFVAGGVLPLVAVAALAKVLPESPQYLAGKKLPSVDRGSIAALFRPDLRRDTIGLWLSFNACLLAVYMAFNWLPTLLAGAGLAVISSRGILAFNLGGAVGAIVAGLVIGRAGSRVTMLTMAAGAVICTGVLASMTLSGSAALSVMLMLTATGALINAVQTTMYALAAHVYPTMIRATGVGTAVGFGRAGGVLSTYAGSWALASGGTPRFFQMMSVAMLVVFLGLAMVGNHIKRVKG